MPANLPSFGELLHSLQETESSFPAIAQGTTRSQRRTPSPKSYSRSGASTTLPQLTFAANNAQLQATLPRVTRGVRYQPYSSSASILSRRTSLPHLEYEDSSRVPSICLIKRHKSTLFDDRSRQRTQLAIPVPPPISSLLRGGTRSPESPSSPTSPRISPRTSMHSSTPLGPVSLPTLPTFSLNKSQSTSQLTAPAHQQPTRLPKLKPIQDRAGILSHSRGSSSAGSGSISSIMSMSTDDSGAMGSISSLSGGTGVARSRGDTPSISITRPRARSHRVWTASGYRYPPVATAVAQ
ncbi:hypothetical protein FS837_001103 [Tulasnella sp. UAMH 9824]|nr:hypothetical protein FS837_001103 [Tulasnella sp. UAMH 9824]